MTPEISTIVRPIKYEDLNHHHTLFAGRGVAWMVEAGFIAAARCVGKPEDVVCAQLHGMRFQRPVRLGDLAEIRSQVARLGTTSITAYAALFVNDQPEPAVAGYATFVTVDRQGKPYAHGKTLPPDYAARHPAVCAGAEALRPAGGRSGDTG